MPINFIEKLPVPAEIKKQYPLSARVSSIRLPVTRKSARYLPESQISLS